jgi:pimeloyl-ACP methyl ester carboxylesterase
LEKRLSKLPPISAPTITMDGDADGVVVATDGKAVATKFTGWREHRVLANVGHNPPQEKPRVFSEAVWELASATRRRPM